MIIFFFVNLQIITEISQDFYFDFNWKLKVSFVINSTCTSWDENCMIDEFNHSFMVNTTLRPTNIYVSSNLVTAVCSMSYSKDSSR